MTGGRDRQAIGFRQGLRDVRSHGRRKAWKNCHRGCNERRNRRCRECPDHVCVPVDVVLVTACGDDAQRGVKVHEILKNFIRRRAVIEEPAKLAAVAGPG